MEIGGLSGGVNTSTDTIARNAVRTLFTTIREQIATIPGVEAVSFGSIPLRPGFRRMDLKVEGRPLRTGEAALTVDARFASPTLFKSLGIPLKKGRFFEPTDVLGSGRVAIVNEMLAERLFPGEDPIGRRIAEANRIEQYASFPDDWRTIVGVVGNTPDEALDVPPSPAMFYPQFDGYTMSGGLVVRAAGSVAAVTAPVVEAIRRLAPMGTIDSVMTMSQLKDRTVAPRRLNALLISLFGLLAMLIAAVGIAGVLGFAVSARTNEIGIRMSLGAEPGQVQRMILKEGGVLVVLGLVMGAGAALAASMAMRGVLFGVEPYDPFTFTTVGLLMGTIGIGACWIPARRAARIDPGITMRTDG
jgi:predicted permease